MNIISAAIGSGNWAIWHYMAWLLFLLPWAGIVLLFFYCRRIQRSCHQQQMVVKQLYDHCDELEKILHSISRLAKVSYFMLDADNQVIARRGVNGSELKLPEYYQAHMLPEDRELFHKNCQQLFNGEHSSFEATYTLLINGKRKRHLNHGQVITTRYLQRKKFLLLAMDISDFEQQAGELARTGSILSAIFDNLPGHMFLKNISSDFSYLRCNSTYSKLLNRSPEELIGKNDFDLFDRDLATKIRACDLSLITSQSVADNRWFFVTPDGQEHAIRFISRVLKLTDGFECILGFGVDVTRQEHITSKLRKRNKEQRILLSQSSEKIMLLDEDLQIVCATAYWQNKLSLDMGSAEPVTCGDVFNCRISDCSCCAARQAFASGTEATCTMLSNCILHFKPISDTENHVIYLAVTVEHNNSNESLKIEV